MWGYDGADYSIVPELTQNENKMILVDEMTLCTTDATLTSFNNLVLIVNCHESECDSRKYKVGSCQTENPPKVVCHAVHDWFDAPYDEVNQKNDEIQA